MPLFDLADLRRIDRMGDVAGELTRLRIAAERIAAALEKAITIPEQPEIKRAGLEALGTYGEQEPESPEQLRERLVAMGVTDLEVEQMIVDRIFGKGEA